MSETIKLRGFDDVRKGLDRLDRNYRMTVGIEALEESARPMEHDYKGGAHPEVADGVRTRVLLSTPSVQRVAVGTKHPLVHIFEFGTRQRRRNDGGRTGRVTAMGFARRAFDVNVAGWFRLMGKALARRLDARR